MSKKQPPRDYNIYLAGTGQISLETKCVPDKSKYNRKVKHKKKEEQ